MGGFIRRRAVTASVLGFGLVSGCLVASGSATAAVTTARASSAKPIVSFTFAHSRVSQNTQLTLTAKAAHLPGGSHVYLQRQEGTQHVWKRVKQLVHSNGVDTAPGVEFGKYAYRLRVVKKDGTQAAVSKTRTLFSYGNFSSNSICNGSQWTDFNWCGSGTIQVGGNVFAYHQEGGTGGNTGPGGEPNVQAQKSSCRSLTIEFAVPNDETNVTSYGAAMSTATADQQRQDGTLGQVTSTTFKMGSKVWDLILWTNTGEDYVFWTGTFSCWNSKGDA